MDRLTPAAASGLRDLIDEYRARCLWFLKPDYYPATEAEVLRVLDERSSEIRQWLSQSSSAASAGS